MHSPPATAKPSTTARVRRARSSTMATPRSGSDIPAALIHQPLAPFRAGMHTHAKGDRSGASPALLFAVILLIGMERRTGFLSWKDSARLRSVAYQSALIMTHRRRVEITAAKAPRPRAGG